MDKLKGLRMGNEGENGEDELEEGGSVQQLRVMSEI